MLTAAGFVQVNRQLWYLLDMNPAHDLGAIEPDDWFVVFHRKGANRLIDWLAMGQFKHVSAIGYCAGLKAWLIYDLELGCTRLQLLPHNDAAVRALTVYMRDCAVVVFTKEFPKGFRGTAHLGFYCVTAIKSLLGVHCLALRPDGLYRTLLRKGGRPLNEPIRSPTAAARPRLASGEKAGAAIANQQFAG